MRNATFTGDGFEHFIRTPEEQHEIEKEFDSQPKVDWSNRDEDVVEPTVTAQEAMVMLLRAAPMFRIAIAAVAAATEEDAALRTDM